MGTAVTNVSFDNLLKEYLPYDLLVEEVIKRDFLLSNVKKDNSWKGGDLKVPFIGNAASSMAFGRLPGFSSGGTGTGLDTIDSGTNIVQDNYVVASINAQKELWGSMIFNDRDLSAHGSLEQSFLKILPDRINAFTAAMRESLSGCLLTGGHIDTIVSSNNADDTIVVNRPERFSIGQFIEIRATGTTDETVRCYVKAINMNSGTLSLDSKFTLDDEDHSVDLDNVADGDKIFHENGANNSDALFSSLASQLMAAESTKIFGLDKVDYPHLQAYENSSVGDVEADSGVALSTIFDAMVQVRRIGKGNPTDVVMSYELYAQCLKELDGKLQYSSETGKASKYGWSEISVGGPKGSIKLVAVPEMDKDKAFILDWNAIKLHSNGMIERRSAPDGKQFYEVRAAQGFQYIVDHRFFGELVVSKPSHCGALSGITYSPES